MFCGTGMCSFKYLEIVIKMNKQLVKMIKEYSFGVLLLKYCLGLII